jgi:hypothetical protein
VIEPNINEFEAASSQYDIQERPSTSDSAIAFEQPQLARRPSQASTKSTISSAEVAESPTLQRRLTSDRQSQPTAEPSQRTTSTQRRREQNRAAQRAYRERKDNAIRTLQERLDGLQGQYHALLEKYEVKEKTVQKLNDVISNLILELAAVRRETTTSQLRML